MESTLIHLLTYTSFIHSLLLVRVLRLPLNFSVTSLLPQKRRCSDSPQRPCSYLAHQCTMVGRGGHLSCSSGLRWYSHFLSWTCLLEVPRKASHLLRALRQELQKSEVSSVFSGKFSTKAYKMSEPEEKLVHQLGMIAGGTGKRLPGASSVGEP